MTYGRSRCARGGPAILLNSKIIDIQRGTINIIGKVGCPVLKKYPVLKNAPFKVHAGRIDKMYYMLHTCINIYV